MLYLRSREKNWNKKRKTSKQHFLLSVFIILTVTLRYASAIHVKLKKQNYQSTKTECFLNISFRAIRKRYVWLLQTSMNAQLERTTVIRRRIVPTLMAHSTVPASKDIQGMVSHVMVCKIILIPSTPCRSLFYQPCSIKTTGYWMILFLQLSRLQ